MKLDLVIIYIKQFRSMRQLLTEHKKSEQEKRAWTKSDFTNA